jgi:hypothetical protein
VKINVATPPKSEEVLKKEGSSERDSHLTPDEISETGEPVKETDESVKPEISSTNEVESPTFDDTTSSTKPTENLNDAETLNN